MEQSNRWSVCVSAYPQNTEYGGHPHRQERAGHPEASRTCDGSLTIFLHVLVTNRR